MSRSFSTPAAEHKEMIPMIKQLLAAICLWMAVIFAAGATETVTYVYTDPQGTPLAEADAKGNVTATFDYTPYGTVALGASPNGPGYTGHVNDAEANLVYMQRRYYDSSTGRFLSVDPIGLGAPDAFNIDRYTYAQNDPVGNVDPTGAFPQGMSSGQIECEVYACQISGTDGQAVQRAQTAINEANAALKSQGVLGHAYGEINALTVAWANAVVPVTKRMHVEIGSDIMYLQNSGYFSSAAYSTGNEKMIDLTSYEIKMPSSGHKVAEIHTHPFNNEFSGMTSLVMPFDQTIRASGSNYCCDLNRYYRNRIDGYVAMPNGAVYGWNYAAFQRRADEHGPTQLGSGVFTVKVGH